jgi:formylglycine-generating enzyme required for sulfatase activity
LLRIFTQDHFQMKTKKAIFVFLSTLFVVICQVNKGLANNISVSNVTLTGQNTAAGVNNANNFTQVQFNLSWENSHRVTFGPTNWDAAWVFVKYRVSGGNWLHATIASTGQVAPTGSSIDIGLLTPGTAYNATSNPGLGAFIYRNAAGTGNFSLTGVQLRWAYGANAVADNAVVEVQVFAVEMVFVPGGSFSAGDGISNLGFTQTTINTANATTLPSGGAGGYPTGQTAPTANTWPNGFSAFYSMKYEISQQQYVDFLNTLTSTQALNRFPNLNTNRYAITVAAGVYSTTNPFLACNFLTMADIAAYLDWSGLRPMTEMEFEKAGRGTVAPVAGEYAWGTASATFTTGLSNPGLTNEIPSNIGANVLAGGQAGITGPGRVGMFATSTSSRVQAGASYYGIMDLSGNLYERIISLGIAAGRNFTGLHGNGTLTTAGDSDVTNWPDAAGSGSGIKGGSWSNGINECRVSDRSNASQTYARLNNIGGRGVRTAP